jgi:catechol 2,3-dioxygenase-like lactoylglutathione lyase family enzyme
MLDHVGLKVSDFEKSKRFFAAALEPLGYIVVMEFEKVAGLGIGGKPDFWIRQGTPISAGVHVCFLTPHRKTVDAFHAAGLRAGGKDNGAPGVRPDYHPAYYGAFILDPDGNNIEAVCHDPRG